MAQAGRSERVDRGQRGTLKMVPRLGACTSCGCMLTRNVFPFDPGRVLRTSNFAGLNTSILRPTPCCNWHSKLTFYRGKEWISNHKTAAYLSNICSCCALHFLLFPP